MAELIFWEKPGCAGNRRQKQILEASGHRLEVRDLLSEAWTETELARFFGQRPVPEWFNPTNPQVKSGAIVPDAIAIEQALKLLVAEPLLIVRPLMQVGDERLAGFDVSEVHNWIGLDLTEIGDRDPRHCPCVTGRETT